MRVRILAGHPPVLWGDNFMGRGAVFGVDYSPAPVGRVFQVIQRRPNHVLVREREPLDAPHAWLRLEYCQVVTDLTPHKANIRRRVQSTTVGENTHAVVEIVFGRPIVRAAGSREHCERYWQPGRALVDVATGQILQVVPSLIV
jgi:hypothetical protein